VSDTHKVITAGIIVVFVLVWPEPDTKFAWHDGR
jgi:hypothetical protein